MKKVMVYAYTRFNLGDDLFIKILCDRYPNTKFIIYAPRQYKHLMNEIKNLEVYPSDSILYKGVNFIFGKLFRRKSFMRKQIAKKCDVSIYIGGSIFMQGANWEEEILARKSMLIEGKPFFVLGANFGPFKDKEYYIEYKELFKQFTDICFRESYSYELFKDLNNVRMADDVVFQLGSENDRNNAYENNVIISVIKPSYRKALANYNDEIYYNKIVEIITSLNEKGLKVTLMSFCEYEEDDVAVREIIHRLPSSFKNEVNEHYYKYNIQESIKLISNSSIIIASRFHAMILGWVYNKPVFPIVYSDKMTNVMNDVGFKGYYKDINFINEFNTSHLFENVESNKINPQKHVENSEKHFSIVDKFLDRS